MSYMVPKVLIDVFSELSKLCVDFCVELTKFSIDFLVKLSEFCGGLSFKSSQPGINDV